MHGRGLPGSIFELCGVISRSSISTVDQAKALFELNWGAGLRRYWQGLLLGILDLSVFEDVHPAEAIRRARAALCHLSARTKTVEPAFYGLERDMDELRASFERCAAGLGKKFEDLYAEIARHWLNDGIVDSESLTEVSVKTCNILSGRGHVMGQLPRGLRGTS